MFSKIIVGIDGSDGGRDAIALARALADKKADIVLLTAFPYEHRPIEDALALRGETLWNKAAEALEEDVGDDPRCRVHPILIQAACMLSGLAAKACPRWKPNVLPAAARAINLRRFKAILMILS